MVFTVNKAGYTFCFRNPSYDSDTLEFEYKIEGLSENKTNDGFFYRGATYLNSSKVIKFIKLVIDGVSYAGIRVPEELHSELDTLFNVLKTEYINERASRDFKYIMNDMTSYGIYNGISHYDLDYLYAQLRKILPNIDKCNLNMEIVAKILSEDPDIIAIANKTYRPVNENPDWNDGYRILFREQVKQGDAVGYGTIPNAVMCSKLKAMMIENIESNLKEIQNTQQKLDNLKAKANFTGEKQILNTWIEPCNDRNEECNTDICTLYICPNGEQLLERQHTW